MERGCYDSVSCAEHVHIGEWSGTAVLSHTFVTCQ